MKFPIQSDHLEVDRQIESALQYLRDANPNGTNMEEPAAAFDAMNGRLLRNLRASSGYASSVRFRPFRSSQFALPASAAAAACFVALVTATLHRQHGRSPQQSARGSSVTGRSMAQTGFPQRNGSPVFAASVRRSGSNLFASAPSVNIAPVSAKDSNPAMTDPAYLPSFPAPSAPLTREERLLINMAEHRLPMVVARLEAKEPPLGGLQASPRSGPLFAGFAEEPPASPSADPDLSTLSQALSDHGVDSPSPAVSAPERPQSSSLHENTTEPRL